MSIPQITSPPQAQAEVVANQLFAALAHELTYAMAYLTASGLTWGYYGGRWGGFTVADGTFTLTNNSANYIVVALATGVATCSATPTNWNDATSYARVYKVTTSGGVVSAIEDHRAGPGGVHGGPGASSRGVLALTDGATIAVDASQHDQFRVTLGGNRTLANPTGMVDGQTLLFRIRPATFTLAYGSKYKFPGGSVTLSTAGGALDLLSCQYDATDDTLACVLSKAFA